MNRSPLLSTNLIKMATALSISKSLRNSWLSSDNQSMQNNLKLPWKIWILTVMVSSINMSSKDGTSPVWRHTTEAREVFSRWEIRRLLSLTFSLRKISRRYFLTINPWPSIESRFNSMIHLNLTTQKFCTIWWVHSPRRWSERLVNSNRLLVMRSSQSLEKRLQIFISVVKFLWNQDKKLNTKSTALNWWLYLKLTSRKLVHMLHKCILDLLQKTIRLFPNSLSFCHRQLTH